VVATLVRLRFALLINQLKKSPWQIVAAALGAFYGLGMLALIVVGLISLSFLELEFARTVITLAGSATVLGWVLVPLLTAGIDQTVDPARLSVFPIPLNQLLRGLTVAGLLGIPGIITSLAALASLVTWWRHPLALVASLVGSILGVLIAVVGSRMVVSVAHGIGSGRRAQEAKYILVFIPLILLGPIIIGVGTLLRSLSDVLPTIADVLAWTPLGAPWALPGQVAAGEFGRAAASLVIALVTLAAVFVLWRWGLARALETPMKTAAASVSKQGVGFFRLFPGTPTGAVAARALTYWVRDPRYNQSLIMVPVIPLLFGFYGGFNGGDFGALPWMGPVIAALVGMSIYTDVSYDNTAFALHLQTGVSGLADRWGRVIALSTFAAPVALALTIAGVAIPGVWSMLPGMLALTISGLLISMAASSAVSARFTFPVPSPGESPFKSKTGGGLSLMLSTFAIITITVVGSLPSLILSIVSFATGQLLWGWLSLLAAIVIGSILLVVGVRIGARSMDARGPELLVQLQRAD